MLSEKRVVLLLPPYEGAPLGPPAGLLAIAAPLIDEGLEIRVIDAAVDPTWLATLEGELTQALCLGVSLLTGPMILGALAASRLAKRIRPGLPVVFGGWHPTLLPAQTLREASVDVVVRHQGEITFREVVRRLMDGVSLEGVPGCWYKPDGEPTANPDRPRPRIQDLPPLAYHLADFDAYERAGGGRKLPYATSLGCPYTCRYCTDTVFYDRRFDPLDVERTVREVPSLVGRHRIEQVALLDSNFLVNVRRAVAIAQGFVASGARFRWTFQASTDLLCRMSDDDLRLLARSGVDHIGFGTESGSEPVLRAMDKRHQKIGDMFECARKCSQAGIRATYNLIFGFPGETEADRDETIRVMERIGRLYDNVTFSPNLFTPYPGIPVWPELTSLGLREPDSLEGWAFYALGGVSLPWLDGAAMQRLDAALARLRTANKLAKRIRTTRNPAKASALRAMRRSLLTGEAV
jgi:radical SAM superfamily enzyme YgiQ (UPF0313 family)